jgi:hypothetical protein
MKRRARLPAVPEQAATPTPVPGPELKAHLGGPFDAAIAYLRAKLNVPTERWDDIWQAAHDRAFIVAGAGKADLVQDLHQAVEQAVASGGLAGFRRDFDTIVARHGWTGWRGEGSAAGRAWRTAVIYRTNLLTSHAAGRWRQMHDPAALALRPYFRYRHADGVAHPRPEHQAWDGLELHHSHPFWRTHWAPNGWGCHCKIFAIAAPSGQGLSEPPAGWDALDPATGAPVGIDKGFAYAPGARADEPLRQMVQDKLLSYPPAITRALSADVGRYLNANDRPADFARRALAEGSLTETLWLGFVADAPRLAQAAGVAAEGLASYTVTLPADVVRHVQKSHGHDGQGQRPAEAADYNDVAQVLNEADLLLPGGRPGSTVTAEKTMPSGERWRAVFAIQTGKRTRSLALLSLVIKTAKVGKVGGAP